MSRAAYMRDYRAKRKTANVQPEGSGGTGPSIEEVRTLARELVGQELAALRQPVALGSTAIVSAIRAVRDPIRDPMREFHPVPKSGKKGK